VSSSSDVTRSDRPTRDALNQIAAEMELDRVGIDPRTEVTTDVGRAPFLLRDTLRETLVPSCFESFQRGDALKVLKPPMRVHQRRRSLRALASMSIGSRPTSAGEDESHPPKFVPRTSRSGFADSTSRSALLSEWTWTSNHRRL
jgi:hypothetical protein